MRRPPEDVRSLGQPVRTMLVIGSGGHTAELLKITQHLDVRRYRPRYYVMADTDITSEMKIVSVEYNNPKGDYIVVKIPRARHVGQSFFSSIFTTIWSTICVFPRMLYYRPELVLCNGPGTCIPICLIAFLLRAACIQPNNRIVFLESVCRVKSLSLTGKLLMFFADNIFVQWPELTRTYRRVQYIGFA
ncbi:unnamed protein product [Nesidiocoris tenuis]|nr:unnamed protein product [Nesidiocoris tenuis]